MGYEMSQEDSRFKIKKENVGKALKAIKSLAGKETINDAGGKHFSWVDGSFKHKDKLHLAMKCWRWEIKYDKRGNVNKIQFDGEKLGDDALLLNAIAPYVEDGSFIQMEGEDDTRWKWAFDGKLCFEVNERCDKCKKKLRWGKTSAHHIEKKVIKYENKEYTFSITECFDKQKCKERQIIEAI